LVPPSSSKRAGVVRRAKAAVLAREIKALEPTSLRIVFATHLHSRRASRSVRTFRSVGVSPRAWSPTLGGGQYFLLPVVVLSEAGGRVGGGAEASHH